MEAMGNSPTQLRRRRRNQQQQQFQEDAVEEERTTPDTTVDEHRENESRNHVTYHVIVDRGTNRTVIHQEETLIDQVNSDDEEGISEMMAIRIFSRLLGAARMRR